MPCRRRRPRRAGRMHSNLHQGDVCIRRAPPDAKETTRNHSVHTFPSAAKKIAVQGDQDKSIFVTTSKITL